MLGLRLGIWSMGMGFGLDGLFGGGSCFDHDLNEL